jgi:hypothetical protein
MIAWGPHGQHE